YFTKIAHIALRTKKNHTVLVLLSFGLWFSMAHAQEFRKNATSLSMESKTDTLPPIIAPIIPDTLTSRSQSKDSVQVNKPLMEGIVYRNANDYEKQDQKKKELTLYNEAEIRYLDFELQAGKIV